jgi:hypothetical protein
VLLVRFPQEVMSAQISVIGEKYANLPARVSRLEAAAARRPSGPRVTIVVPPAQRRGFPGTHTSELA